MAPNVKGERSAGGRQNGITREKEHRKEILYNGYFYDVTDFIRRHPGGNVIKFYTEPGEDATQAIGQFHFRSLSRVEAIMKSLPKRSAAEILERGTKVQSKHDALTADFNKLTEELQAEGYFKPSIPHVIIRLIEPVALSLIALSIFFQSQTIFAKFLATFFCGFALSRFGWLMHEGGHHSLTGRPKIDIFIQEMCMCLVIGGSASWWRSQHNRHHAMPQRLEHDVDLSALPFVAFHRRTVKSRQQINPFFVKYQALLYWTLDLFLAYVVYKFVVHPRHQLRKRAYHEMILDIPSNLFAIFGTGMGWYMLIVYWMGFFMSINFALSHSHLDVADKPTHWVEYSLTHTANVQPSLFVDYFMGYLNYQIEHHLFPTMPQFRQRQVCERVEALAQKHGLPYRVYSYFEACELAVKNLHKVGSELTNDDE